MRAYIVPAAVAAALAITPVAFAAQSATGKVKAYDSKAMTLTLDGGTVCQLPKTFKDPGLKTGGKVRIS